jgi:CubicO group peptidase (beta-lactamase class C family)
LESFFAVRASSLRLVLLALITLISGRVLFASEPPAAVDVSAFDLSAIDRYIAAEVEGKGMMGLSVAIMRNGEIVFAKGYGRRSIDPAKSVVPETSFAVGSVTKQFTCACILLLAEDGKLSVHDPVAKYYAHLTRADDITLLDLMNHTSGYPDYYPLDFVDRRLLQPVTSSQLLKQYAGGKLDFEPGTRFSYSNTGYILLGGVVEKITGQPFGDFLTKRILKPLQLEHSAFGTRRGLPSVAIGYSGFALSPPVPAPPEGDGWIDAAGGLWASASDLLRWDLALVSGKVLSPKSYELMTTPRKLASGKISSYGCGLRIDVRSGDVILEHTGGVSGFVSFNGVLPRTRSGLVVLSNTEHISATPLRTELFNLLVKEIERQEAPEAPTVAGPEPKEVVLDFLRQLQAGEVDRSKLADEFSFYLTDERIKDASRRLQKLGEPDAVEVGPPHERGGMEVVRVTLTFKDATVRASLYRSPDGKIEQLLFYGE